MGRVRTGLDALLDDQVKFLSNAKVGLLANQASIDANFNHLADLLHNSKACTLSKIFAPEHGFRGTLQDMDSVNDSVDAVTGVPIRSLYGTSEESLAPKAEDLDGLDLLVVDLPDIGSRYYTFAQSLAYSMRVAAKTNTRVLVLDRPNPINGSTIEGAPLSNSCRSFCGYAPVANRHGLTLGELAILMNKGFGEGEDAIPAIASDLTIAQNDGWQREMYFEDTGLPWVYPSPNMPTIETAVIYPGSCLFEATEISEGRGTTKPLELFGAPYFDAANFASECMKQSYGLSGAVIRPISFLPKFQKHAEKECHGVQIHVSDRSAFQPVRWALLLIATAARLYPKDFSWRKQAFEFVDSIPAIDLLFGSNIFRIAVENCESLTDSFSAMETFEKRYAEARKPFLLYK